VIKINKAGYLYIVMTILVGFAGVNTGNNLVYIVASALLSYMLVSGIFGRNNIQGIKIDLDFPEEIYARTDVPVIVKVLNTKRFMPVFLLKVMIDGKEVFCPFIRAESETTQHLGMCFERRGRHTIEDIYIASVFPFNFFTRFKRAAGGVKLLVLPKPCKCPLGQLFDRHSRSRGDRSSERVGHDVDILSIRDYVAGDPPKYINWKSTAKTGDLKTKELSSVELQHVMINFDQMDKADTEHTISCITYMIVSLIRSKVPVGLIIGGETYKPNSSPAHKLKILAKLALYGEN